MSGYNVEELGTGYVRFSNHISMDIIESWAIHLDKFEGSIVVGSSGGIKLDPFGFFWSEGDLLMSATADLSDYAWRKSTIRENDQAYLGPQQHWIAALLGKVPLLPTVELALNTMLISEGLYMSDKLGREVTTKRSYETQCRLL